MNDPLHPVLEQVAIHSEVVSSAIEQIDLPDEIGRVTDVRNHFSLDFRFVILTHSLRGVLGFLRLTIMNRFPSNTDDLLGVHLHL